MSIASGTPTTYYVPNELKTIIITDDNIIKDASVLKVKDKITIKLHKGEVKAEVKEII